MTSPANNSGLISVIVPVYNVEQYVEKCVRSVLQQSYSYFELLLVDDGSTDSSLEICKRMEGEDDRIRVLEKSNGGLSDARNYGIQHVSGEFVTFIDSDDWVEKDYLKYLHDAITCDGSDISTCIFYSCLDGGRTPWKCINSDEPKLLGRREALLSLLYSDQIDVGATCKLYRTELFDGVTFPVGMHFEDVGTTYKLISKAEKISTGLRPLYNYLMRPDSIVHQRNDKVFDRSALAVQAYEELTKDPDPAIKRAALRYCAFNCLSVLRMVNLSVKTQRAEARRLRKEVLLRKKELLKDPLLPKRDRIAIQALWMGFPFYRFAWNVYSRLRKSQR